MYKSVPQKNAGPTPPKTSPGPIHGHRPFLNQSPRPSSHMSNSFICARTEKQPLTPPTPTLSPARPHSRLTRPTAANYIHQNKLVDQQSVQNLDFPRDQCAKEFLFCRQWIQFILHLSLGLLPQKAVSKSRRKQRISSTSPAPQLRFSPAPANTPAPFPLAPAQTPPKPHRESPAYSVSHSRNSALHTHTLPRRPTLLRNSPASTPRRPPLSHAPQNTHTHTPPPFL